MFHGNDGAPWITSGGRRTPIGTLHSDNDNVSVPEGQWRWCSVLTANREGGGPFTVSNDNIKISGKWSRKARIDSQSRRSAGKHRGPGIHLNPTCPPPTTPPELCCSPGTCPRSNVTPRYADTGSVPHQIRNGWGDLALQNLISLRVFFLCNAAPTHECTQHKAQQTGPPRWTAWLRPILISLSRFTTTSRHRHKAASCFLSSFNSGVT